MLTEEEMADIRNTFLSFGIPDAAPGLVWEQVLKTTQSDKKVDAGVIRFVLLKAIGQKEPLWTRTIAEKSKKHPHRKL